MGPNFLDPQRFKDGTPYGPKHYKELVQECWYISDNLHTSYSDVLDLACTDRAIILDAIKQKQDATAQAIDSIRAKRRK